MSTELAAAVGREFAAELVHAASRIEHCLDQLTDAQAWQRERDDMNSIANLVLHLCGNLRQLIVSTLRGSPDTRNRQGEFDERRQIPRAELVANLRSAVDEAAAVIAAQSEADWLREHTFRGNTSSALKLVLMSVAHFRGHTQEIIHLTRAIVGEPYRFAGPPPGKPIAN